MAKGKWLVALVVACCLVVTVAALAYAAGQAKSAVPVQEVVRAERFEVADSAGRLRAVLGLLPLDSPEDGVCLKVYSCDDSVMAELRVYTDAVTLSDRCELSLYNADAEGRSSIKLTGGPLGHPSVTLTAADGKSDCSLGDESLSFGAGPPPPIVTGETAPTGHIVTQYRAAYAATRRIRLGSKNGLPSLSLMDETGRERVAVGLEQDGSARAALRDADGKVTWQAP